MHTATLGTTSGMMVTDGVAVLFGERLAGSAQMKWIRWVAAGLFLVFGIASPIAGLRGNGI